MHTHTHTQCRYSVQCSDTGLESRSCLTRTRAIPYSWTDRMYVDSTRDIPDMCIRHDSEWDPAGFRPRTLHVPMHV